MISPLRGTPGHALAALGSFVHLQKMQFTNAMVNVSLWPRELFTAAVAACIKDFMPDEEYLRPQFISRINA